MKSLEALNNINYKDVTYVLCGHLRRRYRDIFTGRRKSSQLIIRGELARIIRSDTSYCFTNRG